MEATDQPIPHADPIVWKSDCLVRVDQWPLSTEKIVAF